MIDLLKSQVPGDVWTSMEQPAKKLVSVSKTLFSKLLTWGTAAFVGLDLGTTLLLNNVPGAWLISLFPPLPARRWTSPTLTFTDTSLGGVSLGMSLDAAQQAAGMTFVDVGDGVLTPPTLPPGSAYLYLAGNYCIGASERPGRTQRITANGVSLGDNGSEVPRVYGAAAQYLPAPMGGRTPANGYVVPAGSNRLAFVLGGGPGSPIVSIRLGHSDLTPSGCGG